MKALQHLWTGIVAAMTGAALALLVQIIGQMAVGLSIDSLPWILFVFCGAGFGLGVVIGPSSTPANATVAGSSEHQEDSELQQLIQRVQDQSSGPVDIDPPE